MMHDYRPKSVNQHHKMVIKHWFGGRKKDFICMCVCVAECWGIQLQEIDNWPGNRGNVTNFHQVWIQQGHYISDYFVTNFSSNMCTSSFAPSICSGIACAVVDYGPSSHLLIISVRNYAILNISSTNPFITTLTSYLIHGYFISQLLVNTSYYLMYCINVANSATLSYTMAE